MKSFEIRRQVLVNRAARIQAVIVGFASLLHAPGIPGAEGDIRRDATVAAIEQVLPSVVNIATETVIEYHEWYDDLLRDFYGWSRTPAHQQRSTSLGSGVIIDEEGYLLTNHHVVSRASRVQVKLWDGREYDADPLVARPGSDVALLKIRARKGEKFKAIHFAADDDLLLGETVLALGNPFGLGGSVTRGILSSKNRRPSTGKEPLDVEDWLETDAAINPGNSGGPLVNLRGELIGLNVAVAREQQGMGMGFSIPVKQVSAALSHFFTPEWMAGCWLGAQFSAGPGPLVVGSVQLNSPASRAGLREGDQVLEVNGQAATGLIACNRLLSEAGMGEIKLQVARAKERRAISLRLLPLAEMMRQRLGMKLEEVKGNAAERTGMHAGESLRIEEVEPDGPADQARLQKGFFVAAIDGQNTGELRAAAEALAGKKPGESVEVRVLLRRWVGGGYVESRQAAVQVELR